jgi:hypothetical protein
MGRRPLAARLSAAARCHDSPEMGEGGLSAVRALDRRLRQKNPS